MNNLDYKTKRKIRRLGYKVRKHFDRIIKEENGLPDHCGYCARSAAVLSDLLIKNGIRHKIAYSAGHVYLECRGYIVDTTATQFGSRASVSIRKINSDTMSLYYGIWDTSIRFRTRRHLRKWQKRRGWPSDQIARNEDMLGY